MGVSETFGIPVLTVMAKPKSAAREHHPLPPGLCPWTPLQPMSFVESKNP